eukprot:6195367-Pleurochrysis_carterae.AAC.3
MLHPRSTAAPTLAPSHWSAAAARPGGEARSACQLSARVRAKGEYVSECAPLRRRVRVARRATAMGSLCACGVAWRGAPMRAPPLRRPWS